jgi:hypothetical protein
MPLWLLFPSDTSPKVWCSYTLLLHAPPLPYVRFSRIVAGEQRIHIRLVQEVWHEESGRRAGSDFSVPRAL